ncbi:hypothetical protein Taro_046975 [Colocasia esculenta]|uniref:Uncharacterized protein n=1 Tax=Colocasia esculenta TaxID=4460 RepID=A0A843X053_COLES|nr:hypothetical protein [Colocasia esculenta]
MNLSSSSAKKRPISPRSAFCVDLCYTPESGKFSLMFRGSPGHCRMPEEAPRFRINTSKNRGTDISCEGSVDTTPTGVDTMLQTLRQNDEEKCVDTGSSGVDTRSSSQKTCLSVLDSVLTQPEVVSTLVTLPREPILPVWDSVSTHSLDRSTHSGNFFTLSSTWTLGTLGFTWIGLGLCAHAPQGYFWTHWAINTLQLAIQPKRAPLRAFQKSFGGKKCSPPRSCSPGASSSQFSSVQAREVEFDH